MRDVSYLPGAEDREPVKQVDELTIDHLANVAADKGWAVNRRGTTYLQLTRPQLHVGTVQISVSAVNGELKASQVVVLEQTNVSDHVLAWIEEDS